MLRKEINIVGSIFRLRIRVGQSVNHAVLETNEIAYSCRKWPFHCQITVHVQGYFLPNCGKLDCKCRTSFKCL